MSATVEFLASLVDARIDERCKRWLGGALREIANGCDDRRFGELFSIASRFTPRRALAPSKSEIARAFEHVEGWNPERWTLLETLRVRLVLARRDLERDTCVRALEECFQYADVGELCALYKSLAFLPQPARFVWRAGEGCRSSMRAVYEAAACDTPFPVKHFDDLGWRQLVVKALFVEAPLWRVYGLDTRLSDELARMTLDLAEERRSAHRPVQHELWLTLGRFGGDRARASIEQELAGTHALGRRAAAIALARAGGLTRLAELAKGERDPAVRATMEDALRGHITQQAFGALDPMEAGTKAS